MGGDPPPFSTSIYKDTNTNTTSGVLDEMGVGINNSNTPTTSSAANDNSTTLRKGKGKMNSEVFDHGEIFNMEVANTTPTTYDQLLQQHLSSSLLNNNNNNNSANAIHPNNRPTSASTQSSGGGGGGGGTGSATSVTALEKSITITKTTARPIPIRSSLSRRASFTNSQNLALSTSVGGGTGGGGGPSSHSTTTSATTGTPPSANRYYNSYLFTPTGSFGVNFQRHGYTDDSPPLALRGGGVGGAPYQVNSGGGSVLSSPPLTSSFM